MREIKFRAWDKKNRLMFPVHRISFSTPTIGMKDLSPLSVLLKVGHELLMKDIELMQYTGLKDKNGREVYEGDILRNYDGTKLMEVRWSYHGFDLFYAGTPEFVKKIATMGWRMSKVTGNIYENPELLKGG